MDPAQLRKFNDCIRGFNSDIVRVDEIQDYVARGIFDSYDDWYDMRETARTVLTHKTRRNMKRTGTGDDDVKMRGIDPAYVTPDPSQHCTIRIDPGHTPEVVAILAECGLCDEPPVDNPALFTGEHEVLRCMRHIPPVRRGEDNMSPVNAPLFPAMRSMQNVQRVFQYSVNRYVAKYIIKIDLNSHTVLSVNIHNERDIRAKSTFLHNTKIASSAYNEKKRIDKQRTKTHPQGRIIARTEIVQILCRDPQVHTNIEFIKVDTTPLEDRVGLHKLPDTITRRPSDYNFLRRYREMQGNNTLHFVIWSDYVRMERDLPDWRQFTSNQVLTINDNFSSQVTVSKITIFCVRPPVL
jgi:hypothetical protein